MSSLVESIVGRLREAYKDVNCAVACVSGGVDSTVSAILAKIALGNRVYPVFINTGFMRENEESVVREALKEILDIEVYDFAEDIVSAVEGLEDAEEKRKMFRDAFYNAVKSISKEKGCEWIVQGTTRADVIETVGGIKTQHNVLGESVLQRYGLKVIEPLKDLYKHEVRELATILGIPETIVKRQPFPGPGLMIRAVGKLTREKLELVRRVTTFVEKHLEGKALSQYFPAVWEYDVIRDGDVKGLKYKVFGVKVTGIFRGKRTYGHPVIVVNWSSTVDDIYRFHELFDAQEHPHVLVELTDQGRGIYLVALRAVISKDFMTAEVPRITVEELEPLVKGVLRFPGVRAVAFDITPKPPATIEYE